MSDTEALDLIAYYRWPLVWIDDSVVVIITRGGATEPSSDIRDAVGLAVKLQAAWAMAT